MWLPALMANSKYEILQSWYLARLRKVALDSIAADGLTPQALILADRELVEKLIADKAQEEANSEAAVSEESLNKSLPKLNVGNALLIIFLILAIVVLVGLAVLAMQVNSLSLSESSSSALLASLGIVAASVLLCLGAGFFLLSKWIATPLKLAQRYVRQKLKTRLELASSDSETELQALVRMTSQTANALVEVSEREKAIADYSADVICSMDGDGKVLASNTAFYRLLGYGVVGETADKFLLPADIEIFKTTLNFVREKSATRSLDVRALKKDGSVCDLRWTMEWSGSQNQFFCIVSDISVSKELERVKSEFVHMISHDLRTPLSSLQFNLEVIESGIYGELTYEGRKSLAGAQRSIGRLIALIGQLLDLDKCESGHLQLDLKVVPLSEILETAADQLNGFAGMNKVNLKCARTNLYVWAEYGRLTQVLVNLISNAIKYSPPESTVEITVKDMVDLVEIAVVDKGKGIPRAYQNLIFDRYKQVSVADSSEKKGSGLGLAICKALVTVHGGTIGVDSEEGQGSSFWFRVRKASDAEIKEAEQQQAKESAV